jgi:hypothetical protein
MSNQTRGSNWKCNELNYSNTAVIIKSSTSTCTGRITVPVGKRNPNFFHDVGDMRRLPLLVRIFIVQLICWSLWMSLQLNYVDMETASVEKLRMDNNARNYNQIKPGIMATTTVRKVLRTIAVEPSANNNSNAENHQLTSFVEEEIGEEKEENDWNTLGIKYHRWSDPNGVSVSAILWRMRELLDASSNQTDKSQLQERRLGPIPAFVSFEITSTTPTQQSLSSPPTSTHTQLHNNRGAIVNPILQLSWRIYYRRVKSVIHRRLQVLGPFVQESLHQLSVLPPKVASTNFPALYRLYRMSSNHHGHRKAKTERILIPMLWRVDDFRGCDHQNYYNISSGQSISLPHFTLSASPACPNAFCLPSYATMELAETVVHSHGWTDHFANADQRYPWSQKLSLAVWRGSFTGPQHQQRKRRLQPRYQLALLGKQYPHLLDVAVSCMYVAVRFS